MGYVFSAEEISEIKHRFRDAENGASTYASGIAKLFVIGCKAVRPLLFQAVISAV